MLADTAKCPSGVSHPRMRTNKECDSLGQHSRLSSCIHLDLDLVSCICSWPPVIVLDLKIYFPLIFWPRHSLRLNIGLACLCLCPGLNAFASTRKQPLDCRTHHQGGPPYQWLCQICLRCHRQGTQPSGKETSNFWWVRVPAWLLPCCFCVSLYHLNKFLVPPFTCPQNESTIDPWTTWL